jgi:MoaA/NifB/PqqE/SkfB family radical SAM enzyme
MKTEYNFQLWEPFLRRLREAVSPVEQVTLDMIGEGGVARIYLVPPAPSLKPQPHLLVVNGLFRTPLDPFQAEVVRCFMRTLNSSYDNHEEITERDITQIEAETVRRVHQTYSGMSEKLIMVQLHDITEWIVAIALEQPLPPIDYGSMTMADWFAVARGPERMDLAIMPVEMNGRRVCPADCGICYANVSAMKIDRKALLTVNQWLNILHKLQRIGVTKVTFTGGEPLANPDVVKLVGAARSFMTQVNTNGMMLTPEMARSLREAELDVLQITIYSNQADIHDAELKRKGSFDKAVKGIKAAIQAGLNVSVNIPITGKTISGFANTVAFVGELGVKYVTTSAVINAGGAIDNADAAAVTSAALFSAMKAGLAIANSVGIDLALTTPGALMTAQFRKLGIAESEPSCGAAASNMAIGPDGYVYPCQSWLDEPLGNILKTRWSRIWNDKRTRFIRTQKALKTVCAFGGGQ